MSSGMIQVGGATLLHGDCREVLVGLPADSVHCCVTSPPYWGLRDYGVAGQLGLEPTVGEYVEKLVAIFREVRRVLRADGTCWLNLGDSFAGGKIGRDDCGVGDLARRAAAYGTGTGKHSELAGKARQRKPTDGLKPKDLVGVPWRVAFALQDDGWWLRSDIIWAKPNPMPESVTDRPTKAHEYLFLLAKSPRYFFDAEAVKEPLTLGVSPPGNKRPYDSGRPDGMKMLGDRAAEHLAQTGRNIRSVWTIATQPFSGAHLLRGAAGGSGRKVSPDCPLHGERRTEASTAGYGGPQAASQSARSPGSNACPDPEPLDAPAPIQTSLVEGWTPDSSGSLLHECSSPASPHSNESRRTGLAPGTSQHGTVAAASPAHTGGSEPQPASGAMSGHSPESRTEQGFSSGEQPKHPSGQTADGNARTCTCEEDTTITDHFATFPPELAERCIKAGCPAGGTVLDPFAGASTTLLVAERLQRRSVGIEMSPAYVAMGAERLRGDAPLFAEAVA
jgi:DNA modification methylase